ncbi:putative LRR containing protein [Trachipleistophora hominis]|uniref:Putative LRR containing protein n=1 Tax=Trachipleistophora hominis TaxID=72359 RepID=L7JY43_TRAHO|nr:putative LRR containing protein [Trachipleistophora hominis]
MSCCENKNIRLCLYLCYMNSGIVLPCNLTKVSMTDSVINTSIEMPGVLKVLAFKRVVIKRRCHINVGIDCTSISISQVKGVINIPFIKQYFHLTFSDLWSFELQENVDGTIDVLRISNGTCKSDFHIEQIVHMLNLIDIKCSGKIKLIINNNIENAILTNCSGPINFFNYGPIHPKEFNITCDSLELLKSEKDGPLMKVTISSTTLPDWLDLRTFFYYMRINSEGILQPSSFTIYDIKVQKILLKNCVGNIVCDGNNDSNDPIYREKSFFVFQVLDESINVPQSSVCSISDCYRLIMINVQIYTTLNPQSNIVKIYLEFFEVTDGCIVGIDEAFMSLILANCSGEFKISHALYNSGFMINLTRKDNFIKIERTLEGLYNITIKTIEISENINIPMNADTVQLTNITVSMRFFLLFSGMCNNLEVRNFSGSLKFPNVAGFKRFIGCRPNLRTDSSILSTPARHYEWSDVNFGYN